MPTEGDVAQVERIFPLVNAAASPVEYLSEPKSLLAAHKAMRAAGLEVLAVYHTHPTSPPIPSRKDREQSYSNEVVHFIISLQNSVPVMEGWWLTEESYLKADWEVMEECVPGQVGAENGIGDSRSER
jgi:proteasome lid subunit RPN8/RPN11